MALMWVMIREFGFFFFSLKKKKGLVTAAQN